MTPAPTPTLLPCPAGHEAATLFSHDYVGDTRCFHATIECCVGGCGWQVSVWDRQNIAAAEKDVTELWNTRARPGVDAEPVAYFVSGPSRYQYVQSHDEIEGVIATLCRASGDDPDDYTATALYAHPPIPAPPAQGADVHSDHPARHYDRTCPACNPPTQGAEYPDELRELGGLYDVLGRIVGIAAEHKTNCHVNHADQLARIAELATAFATPPAQPANTAVVQASTNAPTETRTDVPSNNITPTAQPAEQGDE